MSGNFSCVPTQSLPFDANKVEVNSDGKPFLTSSVNSSEWRWLTPEERDTYDHDHARADDDGMGLAISGRAPLGPEGDGDESDLGAKWGEVASTEVSPEVAAINATMASTEHAKWDLGIGVTPAPSTERALADQAIAFINSTVGNLNKTRYTLVVFHMGEVNSETTGGGLESYSLVSTIEPKALSQVAYAEAVKHLGEAVQGDDFSTSMEI